MYIDHIRPWQSANYYRHWAECSQRLGSIPSRRQSVRFVWDQGQAASKWLHYGDVKMGTIAPQITSLTIVYSIVYSDQRKHQSSASLAFVRGIHRGIPRTNGHLRGKCFHLMTSSWEGVLAKVASCQRRAGSWIADWFITQDVIAILYDVFNMIYDTITRSRK